LEPGLPLVRAWIISHQYLAGAGKGGRDPSHWSRRDR
jgi:hypothetical protein